VVPNVDLTTKKDVQTESDYKIKITMEYEQLKLVFLSTSQNASGDEIMNGLDAEGNVWYYTSIPTERPFEEKIDDEQDRRNVGDGKYIVREYIWGWKKVSMNILEQDNSRKMSIGALNVSSTG